MNVDNPPNVRASSPVSSQRATSLKDRVLFAARKFGYQRGSNDGLERDPTTPLDPAAIANNSGRSGRSPIPQGGASSPIPIPYGQELEDNWRDDGPEAAHLRQSGLSNEQHTGPLGQDPPQSAPGPAASQAQSTPSQGAGGSDDAVFPPPGMLNDATNTITTANSHPQPPINTMYVATHGSDSARHHALHVDIPSVSHTTTTRLTQTGLGVDKPRLVGQPRDPRVHRRSSLHVDKVLPGTDPHDHPIHVRHKHIRHSSEPFIRISQRGTGVPRGMSPLASTSANVNANAGANLSAGTGARSSASPATESHECPHLPPEFLERVRATRDGDVNSNANRSAAAAACLAASTISHSNNTHTVSTNPPMTVGALGVSSSAIPRNMRSHHHRHSSFTGLNVDIPVTPAATLAGSGSAATTRQDRPEGIFNSGTNVDRVGVLDQTRTGMNVDSPTHSVHHLVGAHDPHMNVHGTHTRTPTSTNIANAGAETTTTSVVAEPQERRSSESPSLAQSSRLGEDTNSTSHSDQESGAGLQYPEEVDRSSLFDKVKNAIRRQSSIRSWTRRGSQSSASIDNNRSAVIGSSAGGSNPGLSNAAGAGVEPAVGLGRRNLAVGIATLSSTAVGTSYGDPTSSILSSSPTTIQPSLGVDQFAPISPDQGGLDANSNTTAIEMEAWTDIGSGTSMNVDETNNPQRGSGPLPTTMSGFHITDNGNISRQT
ncbi:hypothetical protein BGW38_007543 [Lunasporangiospora selenospora]|uniref:Uncharacterized protein n=1 Tax=Lunasporangiospora selenospora TaxID=979761 RepID=A0A9P6G3G6_9FUNG|nr:hypothetical protein BGW38_007543 [Lunasporangiospora selenospora]